MKRLLALLVSLLLFTIPCAWGETNLDVQVDENGLLMDETWIYTGYVEGGVTFAIPAESVGYDVSLRERMAGILLVVGNEDYMLQLRRFPPDAMTFESFRATIEAEPTAESAVFERDGVEILTYRNTRPSVVGELYGIALTGLDGCLYKVSLFTGDSEAFDEEAPVWKISLIIASTCRLQDFSDWNTGEAAQH